ncbi:unnamed protein product [Sphenostylis stenocarpa]|uniref:Uncharacterized protein n=1 Tax=Sphenostylis stenocarpa TaxID=92480 RepID=A0AA86VU75_9FABA|nr:unnamed protein product [Sphenostylis stenocarpa]
MKPGSSTISSFWKFWMETLRLLKSQNSGSGNISSFGKFLMEKLRHIANDARTETMEKAMLVDAKAERVDKDKMPRLSTASVTRTAQKH